MQRAIPTAIGARPSWTVALALGAALLTGCCSEAPSAPAGWEPVKRGDLSGPGAALLKKAEAARNGLARGLVGELTAAIEAGGHVGAIGVCQERAPIIAEEASAEHGVRIGRTSAQLRQPKNAAPEWAKGRLTGAPEEILFTSGDTELRALFPITIAPVCLACHGEPDNLANGVAETLAASYPDDNATGYGDGDLRGWFWVEAKNQ